MEEDVDKQKLRKLCEKALKSELDHTAERNDTISDHHSYTICEDTL